MRIHVERRIELDARSLGQGVGIVGDAVGVRRRTGDEAAARVGRGEEEGVVDVALRDLFRSHHAAEGVVAGRDRSAAVLALRTERAPTGRARHVTASGRPGRRREPHVELAVGAGVDDDQVVVRPRGWLGVGWDPEVDDGAAVVERAGDVVEAADRVGIGDRLSPVIGGGEVRAASVVGQRRGDHGGRVWRERRAGRDRGVPEARCAVEAGERPCLRGRGQARRLVGDQRIAAIEQLDLVRIGGRLPEKVVGVNHPRPSREGEVIDQASVAEDLDARGIARQGPEDLGRR